MPFRFRSVGLPRGMFAARCRVKIVSLAVVGSFFRIFSANVSSVPLAMPDSSRSTMGGSNNTDGIKRHSHTGTNYREGLDFADVGCVDFDCSKDEERCDNYDATNYSKPCCTHIMRDIAKAFDEELSRMGVEYFVGLGTLLGFTRTGKIIPWTDDLDFTMHVDEFAKLIRGWDGVDAGLSFPTKPMIPDSPSRLCVTKNFAGGRLRARNRTLGPGDPIWARGIPYGDIYQMETLPGGIVGKENPLCRHRWEDVYPLERRGVYGGSFEVSFPREPETLLRRYYGPDWTRPPKKKKGHGEHPYTYCKVNYGLEGELDAGR